MISRRTIGLRTALVSLFCLSGAAFCTTAEAQILGTAEGFGVLGGGTVTNTGSSVIQGNVGTSPGNAIVGFPPGTIVPPGTIHAGDAVAGQAQNDLTTAYNTLQGLPAQFNLTGQDLGGMFLGPAVYAFATSAQLTGVLTQITDRPELEPLLPGRLRGLWFLIIANLITALVLSLAVLVAGLLYLLGA